MKKYIVLSVLMGFLFTGCDYSEMNISTPPISNSSIHQNQQADTVQIENTQAVSFALEDEINEKWELDSSQEIYTVIVYNKGEEGGVGSEVHLVDKKMKTDQIIYKDDKKALYIYAVPKIKDAKKVFLISKLPHTDNPSASIFSLDINKISAQFKEFPFSNDMPFVFSSATSLSPDETKLAAAYDIEVGEPLHGKKLVIYDLMNATQKTFQFLAKNEFFSQMNGDDTFAGASDYAFKWINNKCVEAKVFIDDPQKVKKGEDLTEKIYKETKKYCL